MAARASVLAFALSLSWAAGADENLDDVALPTAADRVPVLLEALQTAPSFKVRATAAVALGRLGDVRAAPALGNALAVDDNYAVRVAAATALAKLPSDASVLALLGALTDSDPLVREQADESLALLQLPRFSSLFKDALQSEEPVRRLAAVRALTALLKGGDAVAGHSLLEAIADEDGRIAQAAERAVLDLPTDRAGVLLLDGLSAGTADVRLSSARTLAKRPLLAAVPALVATSTSTSESEEIRLAARDALRAHRSFVDVPAAAKAAADKTPAKKEERAAALRLLGVLGDLMALESVTTALSDVDPTVRLAAARALVDLGGPKSRAALQAAHDKEADPRGKRQLELLLKQMR